MNAVCTIVAKNYLSQARTLGDSLKKSNPDLPYYILLADEADGYIDLEKEKYNVIEFKNVCPCKYKEMAFKYNVLEFNTATKPFFLEYLHNTYGYEKIIYLDPDIYVYKPLDYIYDLLTDYSFVMTPHFCYPKPEYDGGFSEEELLFVGIYNLGFAAVKFNDSGKNIIHWWQNRLFSRGYADKEDALHVDQKWMDFLPVIFKDDVFVTNHIGINAAAWNLQEKEFILDNNEWKMKNLVTGEIQELIFFHFSGFNPNAPETIHKRQCKYSFDNRKDCKEPFEEYARQLLDNGYNTCLTYPYHYSKFDNGIVIDYYHRRMYRKLLDMGYHFDDPFSTSANTLYELFERNNLIDKKIKASIEISGKKTVSNIDGKKKAINKGLLFMKSVLGVNKYFSLMKYLHGITRPEEQMFLLKEK